MPRTPSRAAAGRRRPAPLALAVPCAALLALAAAALTACDGESPRATGPDLSTPASTARTFLARWRAGDYDGMYDLLSPGAQERITRERFVTRHGDIAAEMTATGLSYRLGGEGPGGAAAAQGEAAAGNAVEVPFSVVYQTTAFGPLPVENRMPVVRDQDGWRVDWDPTVIFPELTTGTLVRLIPLLPTRGTIYDRHGTPLAYEGTLTVVGTSKQAITDRALLVRTLAETLQMDPRQIEQRIDQDVPEYYFIPIATLPWNAPQELRDRLFLLSINVPGLILREQPARIYPHGTLAAHVLGYLTEITAEELEEWQAYGYRAGDLVGRAGLEGTFERLLAGRRGARLTVISGDGHVVATLAEQPAVDGWDVHTSLDVRAQAAAEAALGDSPGAAVLLDVRDNSVVAMASHPTFDPNAFIRGLSQEEVDRLFNGPEHPLLNRATQALYPPGSTFKVITAAAGIDHAGYTADSRLPCPPVWFGLGPNEPKRNWQSQDLGAITIAEGLMTSCNPVFYQIALDLDHRDPTILPQLVRDFGFGRPTGLLGLPEEAGTAPGPDWKERELGEPWYSGDSVNMGIGQGYLNATPLQIVNYYAALAGPALLRTPVLVTRLTPPAGAPPVDGAPPPQETAFQAREIRRLPISEAALAVIRQGTAMVVADPRGTAYRSFAGSPVPAAGKSGTAEDAGLQSHALFVAYAPRDAAQAAGIVVLDKGESGSLEAGPMVRRMLEAYLLP